MFSNYVKCYACMGVRWQRALMTSEEIGVVCYSFLHSGFITIQCGRRPLVIGPSLWPSDWTLLLVCGVPSPTTIALPASFPYPQLVTPTVSGVCVCVCVCVCITLQFVHFSIKMHDDAPQSGELWKLQQTTYTHNTHTHAWWFREMPACESLLGH